MVTCKYNLRPAASLRPAPAAGTHQSRFHYTKKPSHSTAQLHADASPFLLHHQLSHRDSNKPFARGLARIVKEKKAISCTRMQPPPQKRKGRQQERNIRSMPAASLKAMALLLLCSSGAAPAPKPRNPRVLTLAGWGRKKQSHFFILLQGTIPKKLRCASFPGVLPAVDEHSQEKMFSPRTTAGILQHFLHILNEKPKTGLPRLNMFI